MNKESIIHIPQSLTHYFYENLSVLNKNSICPLPEEFVLYSSKALEKYSLTNNFFERKDGKLSEKILGLKLLKASDLDFEEKMKTLKDVGDTALVLLGFFSKSIESKMITSNYYSQLAKRAYDDLSNSDYSFYDIPDFYKKFSTSFDYIVKLLKEFQDFSKEESYEKYLLKREDTFILTSQDLKAKVS